VEKKDEGDMKIIKIKPIKLRFNFDTDKDKVLDFRDCKPFNPKKQHDIENYLNKLYEMTNQHMYKWILQKGRAFGQLAKQAELREIIKEYRYSTQSRQCYYNSQMMAISSNGEIDYYEGYYLTEHLPIPLEHGFNVYKGKVIDTTAYKKFGVAEYFGVKIPLSFIRKIIAETGMAEALLWRYYRHKGGGR
jgi:hypothetical protein